MAHQIDSSPRKRLWNWTRMMMLCCVGVGSVVAVIIATRPGYNEDRLLPALLLGLFSLYSFFSLGVFTARIEEGYPPEHRRDWQRGRARTLWILMLLGNPALLFMLHGLVRNDLNSQGTAFFIEFTLIFVGWVAYLSHQERVKMALYFEDRVPGQMHWSGALARHCVELDKIALEAGVMPLSTFGFADDWPHQKQVVTYHRPELGLETISKLREKLSDHPISGSDVDTLQEDLSKMEERLQQAHQNGTRFCFILHGDATNGMECEQRKGFF